MSRNSWLGFGILWLAVRTISPVWAATKDAASCSIADIQRAITASASGGTIIVPPGNCTWTSGLDTGGKALKIHGAGIDSTSITLNGSFNPVNLTGCTEINNCELSGFTFDALLNSKTQRGVIVVSGEDMKKTFRVHHVKILNVCSANTSPSRTGGIVTYASYGLIDHVDISKSTLSNDCSAHTIEVNGAGHKEWNVPIPWNSDNLVVVEASRFDYCAGSASDDAFEGYGGMKILGRFNEFFCVGVGSHGYDSGDCGAVYMEFYGNKFSMTQDYHVFEAIGYRSGTGAIHDNLIVNGGPQQNYNYDSVTLLRMYRPWSASFGIWGGRGAADGNLEKYCDNSGGSHYINACEDDADCAPNYGLCRARLCRRTADNATPFTDSNNYPLTCGADAQCAGYVASGQLPPGTYLCDGTADGDRRPHPVGASAGTATGSSATVLTVAGAPWSPNEWRWFFAYNDTDGSRCLVTANSSNTITCSGIEYIRDGHTQAIGGTLRGARSGATATVVSYEDANSSQQFGRAVLTNVSGTFQLLEELQIGCPNACETVGHAGSGYGLFGGTDNSWQNTDSFHLSIGWPIRQGAGVGLYGTQPDPIYAWNNSFKGAVGGFTLVGYGDYANSKLVVENRDFFNIPKPGHTDIPCPDPRTGLKGSCNLAVPGLGGYPLESDVAPRAPANLRLQ